MIKRMVRRWAPLRFADGKLVHFDRNRYGGGWVLKVMFGPSAGYCEWNEDRTRVMVYGRTFYLAWKSGSREWQRRFRDRGWWSPLECALTKNGGGVPYANH